MILRSPNEISKLLAYNRWANARMLEPAGAVSLTEWERDIGGSFGSLHATLAHTYGAEWVWLERARGVSPPGLPTPGENPTPAALREKWLALQEELAGFARGLNAERLSSTVTYANFQGETWTYTLADILFDVVNHSTYHRGQVATHLRQLGKTPVATDYVRFLDGSGLAQPDRTPEEIARLFAYNRWANARMQSSVADVSEEDYKRTVGGSFSTLGDTLAHLYGADWVWLERFGGRSPRELPAGREAGTPKVLREWEEVQEGWAALASSIESERLRENLAYRSFQGDDFTRPVGDVLAHVVNHSTYHRGQVATLMRQLGRTPASTEYLMMLDEGA